MKNFIVILTSLCISTVVFANYSDKSKYILDAIESLNTENSISPYQYEKLKSQVDTNESFVFNKNITGTSTISGHAQDINESCTRWNLLR